MKHLCDREGLAAQRRRIFLARHAQVDYFDATGAPLNPSNARLNEVGRAQAAALRQSLAHMRFDRAICSRFPRTRETLESILRGEDRSVAIEQWEAFNEIRGGRLRELPGERLSEILRFPYHESSAADGTFLGGEGFASFEARVVVGLAKLLEDPAWTNVLLVAHDAVNRVILGWALGVGLAAMAGLEQDYGCLNIIDVPRPGEAPSGRPAGGLVRAMNFTPYDPAKHEIRLTSMEEVFLAYERRN